MWSLQFQFSNRKTIFEKIFSGTFPNNGKDSPPPPENWFCEVPHYLLD